MSSATENNPPVSHWGGYVTETAVSNLVYSNDPWAVRDVYVDGERVVSNGKPRSLDTGTVVEGARSAMGSVLKHTGLDDSLATRGGWSF